MRIKFKKDALEAIYMKYNRREFIHPDPLEFLYHYSSQLDREIAGLVASSLAYGRVNQILKSVSTALTAMGPSPSLFLKKTSGSEIKKLYSNFKHRFTTGEELSNMLISIKRTLDRFETIKSCFESGFKKEHDTILPALCTFISNLNQKSYLLPHPQKGSACKRLNLFLRWMVRHDDVDPGCWDGIPTSKLIIPLDTHMHKIAISLGLTKRKNASIKTAMEITKAFSTIAPHDPVKYDFALTRFGILNISP